MAPVLQVKDSIPSLLEASRALGLAWCHVSYTLKQNKGARIESRTEKDIPTQGNKPSTAVQLFIFWQGSAPAPGSAFCGHEGVEDCMLQTAFPKRMCSWSETELEHYLSFVWDNNLSSRELL